MDEAAERAQALMAEAAAASGSGDYAGARERYEAALTVLRAAGASRRAELADCLDGLGQALLELGEHAGAGECFREALGIHEAGHGRDDLSSMHSLSGLGKVAAAQGDYAAARELLERVLATRRRWLGEEHPAVADSLNELGVVARNVGQYQAAQAYYEQALAIRRRMLGELHPEVAASLNNLGALAYHAGDLRAARAHLEQALAIHRQLLGDAHPDVAVGLSNLGALATRLGDFSAARSYLEQALEIFRRQHGEMHLDVAESLNNLGALAFQTGEYPLAKAHFAQTLAIRRQMLGEAHPLVAISLSNLGALARVMGEFQIARSYHEQAVALRRQIFGNEHPHLATSLGNLASAAQDQGDYAAAKAYYDEALAIRRRTLDAGHPDIAVSLNNLGALAGDIGDYPAAKTYYEQALAIRREALGDSHAEVANSLDNLGVVLQRLGDYAAAGTYHERALQIRRNALGNAHPEVARNLANLGMLAQDTGDTAAARTHFAEALEIWRHALGALHPDSIYALRGLAAASLAEGAVGAAETYLAQALHIALLPGNGMHLAETYRRLSQARVAQKAREAAIFFGKQAVNAIQQQRGRLAGLDRDLQRSFLSTKEGAYRELADLLVEAGRLSEAQQVLAMLKEEELFDLLRREAASDPRLTFAQLTRLEAEWRRHGDEVGGDLVRLTEEVATLERMEERTAEQEARLGAALGALEIAGQAFRDWLDGLRGEIAGAGPDSARVNLDLLEPLQEDLRALGPDVAMLSYIVGDRRLSIILTTQGMQVSREAELSGKAVNRLVQEFRFALDQQLEETRELAQALWRNLIGPVAPLLGDLGIGTLMIVPYGTLRYLPFAALHDGSAYLVERFAVSVLTLAAHAGLRAAAEPDWHVAGFGVSRELPGYRRLPAVAEELAGIVQAGPAGVSAGSGIYPGVIRLDEHFTEASFAEALGGHQAVHVATHFVLDPAQGFNSHLVLGDGGTLSLERLRDPRFDFHAIELLTLSACETAMGGSGEDGREFEGFAALVQQRGARSVIASLWPVADESTAPLMTAFYRARREGLSKGGALRAAQLALLRGAYPHPYHWGPFILMGNWL